MVKQGAQNHPHGWQICLALNEIPVRGPVQERQNHRN